MAEGRAASCCTSQENRLGKRWPGSRILAMWPPRKQKVTSLLGMAEHPNSGFHGVPRFGGCRRSSRHSAVHFGPGAAPVSDESGEAGGCESRRHTKIAPQRACLLLSQVAAPGGSCRASWHRRAAAPLCRHSFGPRGASILPPSQHRGEVGGGESSRSWWKGGAQGQGVKGSVCEGRGCKRSRLGGARSPYPAVVPSPAKCKMPPQTIG